MTAGASVGPDFYSGVLQAIGAPVTAGNLAVLETWSRYEGTAASWNPLAVGDADNGYGGQHGATPFNSAGVWNYPSEAVGIQGTATALQNGRYNAVVAALRSNAPLSTWQGSSEIQSEINTWGTHGFASLLSRGGAVSGGTPAAGSSSSAGAGPTPSSQALPYGGKVWGYTYSNATQCVSLSTLNTQGGGDPLHTIAYYFGQSCVQKRLAVYAAAGILILMGLKFLGTPGLPKIPVIVNPGKMAAETGRKAA